VLWASVRWHWAKEPFGANKWFTDLFDLGSAAAEGAFIFRRENYEA